jgi:pyruvate/2-oxoglutarate dehydrogenase complex dihydrolipoamide dehydrogenase (E3) component
MPRPDAPHHAIVIGAGSGGLTVAIGLAGLGRRVALIEAARIGGDCTNVGCVPSKRLIHLAREPGARGDPTRLMAAVRATRDALAAREDHELSSAERIDLIRGRAVLGSDRRVTVSGPDGARELTAPHVVIATGSRPRTLDIPGLPPERLLTNESLFELEVPPAHLAIVGAGPIGVEMACAFARMGTRVTLVDLESRVLPVAEPEASQVLAGSLRAQGIDVRLESRVTGYDPGSESLTIAGPPPQGDRIEGVDAVLVAIGRLPNVEGFEPVVETGPDGIAVDGWGRTSARGVWAVGDVTPLAHQTHAANALGRRIVQRIALPWIPPLGGPPLIPSAVFSDPEVAWVGPTAAERARRCHPHALVHLRVDLADTDRGLTDDVRHGFVSVVAVRLTGRIVSATVVGPHASELLPLLTFAISRGTSLLRLQRLVYAYPTFAGAIGAVADEFARRTLPNLRSELAAYGRYRFSRGRSHPKG